MIKLLNNVKEILENIDISLVKTINEDTIKNKKIIPVDNLDKCVRVISVEDTEDIQEYSKYIFNKEVEISTVKEGVFQEIFKRIRNYDIKEIYTIILDEAIRVKASDIHIESNSKGSVVRYRVDGSLQVVRKIEAKVHKKILSQLKIRGNMDITETRRPQDGKMLYKYKGEEFDLRLSTIPLVYGEKIVIRILYTNLFNYTIGSLNLTKVQKDDLEKIIDKKNGLVIVTGPTGSGKSTTLYTILDTVNRSDINITTLEDPIEVYIDGINQINLNRKADIDFKCALRSVLRQDPDIIMLGEIRDEETADIAVKSALTGHKVYSTIHTKTPREVYTRLEDMGIKKYLIKDSLIGIISQRLVKTLCSCKVKNGEYYIENGCNKCGYTGYKGRIGVYSIAYIEGDRIDEIDLSNGQMIESLKSLINNGIISKRVFEDFLKGESLDE